jgi:hypothetical protein
MAVTLLKRICVVLALERDVPPCIAEHDGELVCGVFVGGDCVLLQLETLCLDTCACYTIVAVEQHALVLT